MKEKITLFIALSFVLTLTVYKSYNQNNTDSHDKVATESLQTEDKGLVDIDTQPEQPEEAIVQYNDSEESRAQRYIDNDWAPDETINEIAYKNLGGQYTQYWDNLNLVENIKTEPVLNKKSDNLIKEKVDLVQN